MSEKKRIIAKTVEKALEKATSVYHLNMDEMTYKVIQQPSKGIFGIGSKDAIIEVVPKDYQEPASQKKPDLQKEPVQSTVKQKKEAQPIRTKEVPVKTQTSHPPVQEKTEIIIEQAQRVSLDEPETDTASQSIQDQPQSAEDIGLAFLGPIFKALDVDPVVHVSEEGQSLRFDVTGEDVAILIGRHGETLNAIQFLLSLVINGHVDTHRSIVFDVENYRERRTNTLEEIAHRQAAKCRKNHRRVTLNPMNAAERRIIHLVVEKEEGVSSYSEGNEPHRRVVIVPED